MLRACVGPLQTKLVVIILYCSSLLWIVLLNDLCTLGFEVIFGNLRVLLFFTSLYFRRSLKETCHLTDIFEGSYLQRHASNLISKSDSSFLMVVEFHTAVAATHSYEWCMIVAVATFP